MAISETEVKVPSEGEVDDALTLNGTYDMASRPVSEAGDGDMLKIILSKLEKMGQTLDAVASGSENMISKKLTELAEQIELHSKESAAPAVPKASATSEENESAFLSSTIGQVHLELTQTVGKLKKDLDQKTKENKMLHGVIQNTQNMTEVTDDDIERHFREFRNEIERFSRDQFNRFNPSRTLASSMRSSNHPLWLESVITDQLFNYIFRKPIFGHNCPYEEDLFGFEEMLREENTPDADVRAWVSETVKITSRRGFPRKHPFTDKIAHSILKLLEDYVEFSSHDTLFDDMRFLCRNAYELALLLRRTRTIYQWLQVYPPGRGLDESNFTTIRGYDEPDRQGRPKPYRIRFGPVFKLGNGESICIRKGELLLPTEG